MPIPQFHRTPKTRKRGMRRTAFAQDSADVRIPEANLTAAAGRAADTPNRDRADSIDSGDSTAPPPSEEVPALLSSWPPRRPHSS